MADLDGTQVEAGIREQLQLQLLLAASGSEAGTLQDTADLVFLGTDLGAERKPLGALLADLEGGLIKAGFRPVGTDGGSLTAPLAGQAIEARGGLLFSVAVRAEFGSEPAC